MSTTTPMSEREKHKVQLEIISGYRNKIVLDQLSLEDVLLMLDSDYNYLEQENAVISTNEIIQDLSTTTPTKEVSAMRELIEHLDLIIDEDNEGYLVDLRNGLIQAIKEKAKSLLPKEREQIVEAWQEGYYANCENEENNATDYFNSKYNNQ